MGVKNILSKFPEGNLFRVEESTTLYKTLKGFSDVIDSAKTTAINTITDLNPLFTTNFFSEWGRLLNITDELTPLTDAQKRVLIVESLTEKNPRTAQYFLDLISESGYSAEIYPYYSAEAGDSEAGDYLLTEDGWDDPDYTIIFLVATSDNDTEVVFSEAGDAECGDLLEIFGIPEVEFPVVAEMPIINTLVFYYYDGSEFIRHF